jgi:hypothetical protein
MLLERPRRDPACGDKLLLKSNHRWSRRLRPAGPVLAVLTALSCAEMATATVDKSGAFRLAQRAEARIWIAPEFIAQASSEVSLGIRIGPAEAIPRNSFVRLRGLPHVVSLSEGHSVGPGSWAIPMFALSTLKANIPTGVSGRSELVISLVGVDGALLAEARTLLIVGPAAMTKRSETPLAEPQHNPSRFVPSPVPVSPPTHRGNVTPRPPELSIAERERAEQLVRQGDQYLAQGKVGGARLFFRQAVEAGFALAAIRLGTTYDPTELSRLQVQGITPDPVEARKWYERARELGAPEAEERLARLGGY